MRRELVENAKTLPSLSRKDKIEFSERYYRRVREVLDEIGKPFDDVSAQMAALSEVLSDADAFRRAAAVAQLLTPEGQLEWMTILRWAHEGYPQVNIGHKYGAAVLTTAIPKDLLPQVRSPWSCFNITLPDDLIMIWNPSKGAPESVRDLVVMQVEHKTKGLVWAYVAITESLISLWQYNVSTEQLAFGLPDEYRDADPLLIERTTLDDRAANLISTLIINLCLAMTNSDVVKESGPGHKRWQEALRRNRRPDEPSVRLFQVGQPVVHDFREAVADYLRGEGKKPTVQSRVCGHYKSQPCGPKLAGRKVIWVQPYWRGPEDAPIVTRDHEMRG